MSHRASTDVVTCFVTRNDKVLLLKRSEHVSTYKGFWAGVSGYVETVSPLEQAWNELGEEVGIRRMDATLDRIGEPLDISDEAIGRQWRIHPFKLSLAAGIEPRLDREHVALLWVFPSEMQAMITVPGLLEAWERVST